MLYTVTVYSLFARDHVRVRVPVHFQFHVLVHAPCLYSLQSSFYSFSLFLFSIRIKKLLIREGNEAKNYKQKGVQNVKLTKKIKLSFSFKPKSMCEKCESK